MKGNVALLPLLWSLLMANSIQAQYFRQRSVRCMNPNQRAGTCVSIDDCQTLYSVLQRQPLQPIDVAFLRESACAGGYGRGPHVCCSGDTGFTRQNDVEDNDYYWEPPQQQSVRNTLLFPANDFVKRSPVGGGNPFQGSAGAALPQPPVCGGVTIENKIYGGENADLYEFPWMVLLEYKRRTGGVTINCAGSLINQRYVVTAAHCVVGAIERRIGQLTAIRLGEHDITKQIDCNGKSCASASLRVGIDEIIPHELYADASTNKQNDIALVRLDRNVQYSDSIKPICLPSAVEQDSSTRLQAGTRLTVAGWGRTLKSPKSAVKQKLIVPLVDQEQCRRKYRERPVEIVDTQICAGGTYAEDSCDGDSGGPLMRYRGGGWVLEGVVSFGYKCGLRDWPAVHTRVESYDAWIRSKVRV